MLNTKARIACVFLFVIACVYTFMQFGFQKKRNLVANTGEHYDVLVNSYMRSGSTLTGMVFGWRKDAIYLNEPLWRLSRMAYWHTNKSTCKIPRHECGYEDAPLHTAMYVLNGFYDCDLNRKVISHLNMKNILKFGGPGWRPVVHCLSARKRSFTGCIEHDGRLSCLKSSHRVAKVLRLSAGLLGTLLQQHENLKILHLVRDPRAVIRSRRKTGWPLIKKESIIANAKALCKRMKNDLREGSVLQRVYPERFKFILYEDLIDDLPTKVKLLSKYLGMDFNKNLYHREIKKYFAQKKKPAAAWMKSMNETLLLHIDSLCADVYRELGYKSILHLGNYKNYSGSIVDIPDKYKIK